MKKIILSILAIAFATAASMAQYRSISPYHYYNAGANSYIGNDGSYANTSAAGKISWSVSKSGYASTSIPVVTVGASPVLSSVDLTKASATSNTKKVVISISANPATTIGFQFQDKAGKTANFGTTPANVSIGTSPSVQTIQYTAALLDGYSGGCTATLAGACKVDSTQIGALLIGANPGGTYTGTITVDYIYFGDSIAFPILGVASGATVLNSGDNFAVGTTVAGTASATKTITINNTGLGALTFGGPAAVITGAKSSDFVITQPAGPVAAAGNTTFTVGLSSTASAGPTSATLTIASNDPLVPSFTLNLVGNVTAAPAPVIGLASGASLIASGSTFDIGTSTVGTPYPVSTFTIGNVGTATLNITNVTISGAGASDFVGTTPISSTVAVGNTTTFTIGLSSTATTPGAKTATVTITSDDPATPSYTFTVTGTVNAPTIGLVSGATTIASASSFDIGTTITGAASAAKTITIKNTGLGGLYLSGTPKIAISGTNAADFVVTQTGVTSPVAASTGTTSFTVNLSASAAASATAKTATLTIASNDPAIPSYTVNLTGIVNFGTAISEALSKNTVISPNPFSDNINVKLSSAISGNVDATVRNTYGVAVTQVSNVPASEFNISAANLAPGIYILEVTTNDGTTAIKRIVKQ